MKISPGLETICDVGRLLVDVQRDECKVRKKLAVFNINVSKPIKESLLEYQSDEYLFGKSFDEKLNERRKIEKATKDLSFQKTGNYSGNN